MFHLEGNENMEFSHNDILKLVLIACVLAMVIIHFFFSKNDAARKKVLYRNLSLIVFCLILYIINIFVR